MRPWIGTPGGENVDLETRRRRFGKFIGLQGCESPVRESFEQWEGEWAAAMAVEDEEQDEVHMIDGQCRDRNESGNGSSGDVEMALDMDMDMEVERMEREWQEGLGREYDSQGHRWGLK